jgi:hypothetical protein
VKKNPKNQWADVFSTLFKTAGDTYANIRSNEEQLTEDTEKAILSERERKMKESQDVNKQQQQQNWLSELIQGRPQPVTTFQSKELGGYEIPKTEFKKQPLNPLQQALNYSKLDAGGRYAFNRYEKDIKDKETEEAKEQKFNYKYKGGKIFKEYAKDKSIELVGDDPFYTPKITGQHWVTNTDGSRTLWGFLDADPNKKQRLGYQPPGTDVDVDPTSPKFVKQMNDISENIEKFEIETLKIKNNARFGGSPELVDARNNALKTKKRNSAMLLQANMPTIARDLISDYIDANRTAEVNEEVLSLDEIINDNFHPIDDFNIIRALKMWENLYGDIDE